MMWNIKTVAKKYEEYNLSAEVVLISGIVCFVLAVLIAIQMFYLLWDFYYYTFGFSLVLALISFYLAYELLTFLAFFVIERFVKLFNKK